MLGYFYQRSSGVNPGWHRSQPRATLGPLDASGLTSASGGLSRPKRGVRSGHFDV